MQVAEKNGSMNGSITQDTGKDIFTTAFRGYATEEVDKFVRNVATKDAEVRTELEAVRAERDKLRREVDGFTAIVNGAKTTAQRAEQTTADAKAQLQRLQAEIESLRNERDSFQSLAEKFASDEGQVREILRAAAKAADEMRENARAEAETIRKESEERMRAAVEECNRVVAEMNAQRDRVKAEFDTFSVTALEAGRWFVSTVEDARKSLG